MNTYQQAFSNYGMVLLEAPGRLNAPSAMQRHRDPGAVAGWTCTFQIPAKKAGKLPSSDVLEEHPASAAEVARSDVKIGAIA